MSSPAPVWTGYFAASLLPLLYTEIPGAIVQIRMLARGSIDEPPSVRFNEAARGMSVAPHVELLLLSTALWCLIRYTATPIGLLGFISDGWKGAATAGVGVALGLLALPVWAINRFQPTKEQIEANRLTQRSVAYWLPLMLIAAAVEEVWRAFCLATLANHGTFIAVAVTTVAFAWSHQHSRGHALGAATFGICASVLFLWTASLWSTVSAHVIFNMGSLFLARRMLRAVTQEPKSSECDKGAASPTRITPIRPALSVKCPSCGADIPWRRAAGHVEFLCPACGHGVHLRNAYFRVLYVISAVLVALVAYGMGVRGDALFATVLLGLFPTNVLVIFVSLRLFPPDAESTGDYRGILYASSIGEDMPAELGSPRDDRSDMKSLNPVSADPAAAHPVMFDQNPEPRTLEAVVLRGGAIVLVVSMAWIATEPLIHRVLPELGATKHGPPSFPVTVHVGQDGIGFTNGSTERWACKTDLGFREEYRSTFAVEPQQTREVSYVSFRQNGEEFEAEALRRAAREKIAIDCVEQLGRTHFWEFR